jgi:PilZ domain
MPANPIEFLSGSISLQEPDFGRFAPGDRRKRVRTGLHWPILFVRDDLEAVKTTTQNLSSEGFYYVSEQAFDLGDTLVCRLQIPTHRNSGEQKARTLECQVQVVRVERQDDGHFGIACRIQDYRFAHDLG